MNANYSEALEQQVSLLRRFGSRIDAPVGEGGAAFYRAARFGDTFFIGGAGFQLVMTAAATLPNSTRLSADIVPSRQGFVLLDRAVPQVSTTHLAFVHGFVWDTVMVRSETGEVRGPAVAIGTLLEGQTSKPYGQPVLVPGIIASWRHDLSLGEAVRRETEFGDTTLDPDGNLMRSAFRMFGALCLFVEQRILTTRSQAIERHARKRLERDGSPLDPLVRVVELRRREVRGVAPAIGVCPRDWQYQWLVRGHWRQQPYPKVGEVRPKWITPYVKGPEDKPLKAPRATVFAVVR